MIVHNIFTSPNLQNILLLFLIENTSNKENLSLVETCLFIVCLDRSIHNLSDEGVSHQDMFTQMVTGHGCNINGSNRWFDKTIQVRLYLILNDIKLRSGVLQHSSTSIKIIFI